MQTTIQERTIGDVIQGKGVFVGQWSTSVYPYSGEKPLTFDVYAAPEDLVDAKGKKLWTTGDYATERLNDITKKWHGHKGEAFFSEKLLQEALKGGSYKGGWIIPTVNMMETNVAQIMRNGSKLKDTFGIAADNRVLPYNQHDYNTSSLSYCSSTRAIFNPWRRTQITYVGRDSFSHQAALTRPVRLERALA